MANRKGERVRGTAVPGGFVQMKTSFERGSVIQGRGARKALAGNVTKLATRRFVNFTKPATLCT
jgi:hypothetical protein